MEFVYHPEGADQPKTWDFEPRKLMSPEAEAIERLTGMTFGEWESAVRQDSVLALHGLLYVLLKRETPTLKWDQVQFSMSEVYFRFSPMERVNIRAGLRVMAANDELSTAQLEYLQQLEDDPELEGISEPDEPPAPPAEAAEEPGKDGTEEG